MGDFGGGFAQGFGPQFQAQQQRGLEAELLKVRLQSVKSEEKLRDLQGKKLLMEIQNDPNAFFEKFMGMLQGQQPGPTGTLPQQPMGGAGQAAPMGGPGGFRPSSVSVGPSGPTIKFDAPQFQFQSLTVPTPEGGTQQILATFDQRTGNLVPMQSIPGVGTAQQREASSVVSAFVPPTDPNFTQIVAAYLATPADQKDFFLAQIRGQG
ncbi:MAG TPA: hypothetical protein VGA18_07950, partial [Rhodothermales bacterium]